jgi:trimethylamine--corrinoid protein Co-methyltransferase
MIAAGHAYAVLSPSEQETIHRNVLRIVDEVGLQVEHEGLLERMAAIGGRVDRARRRVTFSPQATEAFLATSERWPREARSQRVSGEVSVYYGRYLDPETGEYLPMTTERAAAYFQVARAMSHVGGMGILGCPLEGVPPDFEPLYERYWAWRLGVQPHGSIHRTHLCPAILEMCQVHASQTGRPLEDVFTAGVYLVPPLKLGYQEAEQVAWFLERGLRVGIGGSMATAGATAPVTLAGMVTITIAEALLLGMLKRALYGDRTWNIWMAATMLDPRTSFRPYGRPDMVLANLAGAQMARHYGAAFAGQSGLADAMKPSPEAAAQKAISALATLLAVGKVVVPCGLLGVDEVFSPVQIALDDELVGALAQFARDFEFSDASIAADVVAAVGPGGNFMAEPHTAAWLRRELWEPRLWERQPFGVWWQRDGKTDVERAREWVLAILAAPVAGAAISDAEERELRNIIEKA